MNNFQDLMKMLFSSLTAPAQANPTQGPVVTPGLAGNDRSQMPWAPPQPNPQAADTVPAAGFDQGLANTKKFLQLAAMKHTHGVGTHPDPETATTLQGLAKMLTGGK